MLPWTRLLIPALIALLSVPGCQPSSRENAADPAELAARLAQARTPDQQLAVLDALSTVRAAALPASAADPRKAVRTLLAAPDPVVAAKAGDLLAYWGDRAATPALLRLLHNPDPVIRLSAAISLTALGDPAARAALVAATADPDRVVRAQACTALGAGVPSDAPGPGGDRETRAGALRPRLQDASGSVRAAAAGALGATGSPADIPRLVPLLSDRSPGVVSAAAGALGALGDPRGAPPLVALLGSPEQPARLAAAAALGALRDPAAIPALVRALDDPDPIVRAAALNALGDIGDPDPLPAVIGRIHDPDGQVVRQVPHVLGRLHQASAGKDVLSSHLQDPDGAVRAVVALALGIAGDHNAIPRLLFALDDPDPRVRRNAADALGRLVAVEAAARLERLATEDPSPAVRDAARLSGFRLYGAAR